MIESKHREELHKLLRVNIYALGLTGVATSGVPDAWYSGSNRDLWCEHKRFPRCPPTIDLTNTNVTSALQQDWLVSRYAEGRDVSMIIFVDKALRGQAGCLLLHRLDWQQPIPRDEFLKKMKTRRELADEIVRFVGARTLNVRSAIQPAGSAGS